MYIDIKPDSLNLENASEKQQTHLLLFKDRNQTSFLPLKLESVAEIFFDFKLLMKERVGTLDFINKSSFAKLQNLRPTLHLYNKNKVSYSQISSLSIESLEGINISVKEYGAILRQALDLTHVILEQELVGLNKVVGQLVANKNALISFKPVPAVSELNIHKKQVDEIKDVLKKTIKNIDTKRYTPFGEAYYSFAEYSDCIDLAKDFNKQLNQIKAKGYGKKINEAVQGIDTLISKMENTEDIPKANIELYSNIIEECSVTLSFAGATLSLIQTFIATVDNHNELVTDYNKETK